MAIAYSHWLAAGLILLAPVARCPAVEPPDDAALKARGLVRSGTTYVLSAESEVQKKINTARALFRSASSALGQKAQYERELADAQAEIGQVEQQLLEINQTLARGVPPAQHNQLAAMNNALGMRLNQLHRQSSDDVRRAVAGRAATEREAFVQAVLDLRKLVDETERQYKELSTDTEVKSALQALNAAKTMKTPYTLGPSRGYLANKAQLEKFEKSVLKEEVPLRKEGGIYWVDVTFNGKITRPMVFDTGASIVVLPAGLAAEVGLNPGPNDQVVTAVVADGSEVKARRMVVPSLRVGKFTVENVECVVMPPDKRQVAPLLGQTFQRNFSIQFNADAGKLSLTKLDEPEPKPPPRRPKDAPKRRR
jgi:clan AA aspartic protease (TIGR02281 family)